MPLIITATDFSDIAGKAVDYACRLATDMGIGVTVLHSFVIPVNFSDATMPVLPLDEIQKIAEEKMAEVISGLKDTYPVTEIKGKILYGDILDCLQEYTDKEEQPWAIVLGNDSGTDSDMWLGSTLLTAMRSLDYPVIAVPPVASYNPVHKICFACDYNDNNTVATAQAIADMVLPAGAELHVLHVGDSKEINNEYVSTWQQHLEPLSPQYHFTDNRETDKAIDKFAEDNSMDWLMIAPHHHSFLQGLFQHDHTKALARITHLPIVAVHGRAENRREKE
ncbi:MAG: universal stress protein [Taibaiella sp.]|nr:universal stress protein [Taibaiella sp.]